MKNQAAILTARIRGLIDFHAASVPSRVLNTGSPERLAKSLGLADAEQAAVMLESGRLKPIQLHRNAPKGTLYFSARDVEAVKREAFAALAEQVIENYDGDPGALVGAVHVALASYAKGLNTGTAAKGFSARPGRVHSFARKEEERPGFLRRAAAGAAVTGAAYGGLSYIRGRRAGASSILGSIKAGNAANIVDARKIGTKIAGFIRPRKFSANLTPARARSLMLQLGRELRARNLA